MPLSAYKRVFVFSELAALIVLSGRTSSGQRRDDCWVVEPQEHRDYAPGTAVACS